MDLVLVVALIGLAGALSLIARRWVVSRWCAGGLSATAAAIFSMAITYVPVLLLIVVAGSLSGGGFRPGEWVVVVLLVALAALPGFALQRAVFGYMERHEEASRGPRRPPEGPLDRRGRTR
jgi:hypothetical protein